MILRNSISSKVLLYLVFTTCWILAGLGSTNLGQSEENWFERAMSLKLAQTTKSELEDRFPDAKVASVDRFETHIVVTYDQNDGYFSATYSELDCTSGNFEAYNVPKSTLVSFSFYAFKPLALKQLEDLDLRRLEKTAESDTPIEVYRDFETGKSYSVLKQKKLKAIRLFRTEEMNKALKCK